MTSTLPLADPRDMVCVHQVFRDALAAAPKLVGEAAAGDAARAQTVVGFYNTVLRLLHAHHDSEDAFMTPLIAVRGTPEESAEIARIAGQHADVVADLDAAETALAAWKAAPGVPARAAALAALSQLEASLAPHLAEEEEVVVPLVARYLNAAEWGKLPEHGLQAFEGDELWMVLGLIQEQMPAPILAAMETHMPPPLLQAWNATGKQTFADQIAVLRN